MGRSSGLNLDADLDALSRDPAALQRIEAAFLEHALLVFPNQAYLTQEGQNRFAERLLGPLDKTMPEITFSNHRKDGPGLLREDEVAFKQLHTSEAWHTDHTFLPVSLKAGLLYAEEVPSSGGETEFCDMRAAYDSLDEKTKAQIENMASYCSNQYALARKMGVHPDDTAGDSNNILKKGAPLYPNTPILRPLVKTHPETGRKSLFVTMQGFAIPGLESEESAKLMDDLISRACQAPRTYKHPWRLGDLVIWDQRCVNHRARSYDPRETRKLRGTRVAGDAKSEAGLAVCAIEAERILELELQKLKAHPEYLDPTRLR